MASFWTKRPSLFFTTQNNTSLYIFMNSCWYNASGFNTSRNVLHVRIFTITLVMVVWVRLNVRAKKILLLS